MVALCRRLLYCTTCKLAILVDIYFGIAMETFSINYNSNSFAYVLYWDDRYMAIGHLNCNSINSYYLIQNDDDEDRVD